MFTNTNIHEKVKWLNVKGAVNSSLIKSGHFGSIKTQKPDSPGKIDSKKKAVFLPSKQEKTIRIFPEPCQHVISSEVAKHVPYFFE